MSESSLSLGYPELRRAVARQLGFNADSDNWSTDESTRLDEILKSGLRQFYIPPPVTQKGIHKWSFLYPKNTLTTVSGTKVYDLPDDLEAINSVLTFDDEAFAPVRLVSDSFLREKFRIDNSISTFPIYASIVPQTTTGTTGQRKQIEFYPIPDDAYTLSYTYFILPQALTESNPYPYGGMVHAETIKESCLAIAEAEDDREGDSSIHQQKFIRALQASIKLDSTNNKPTFYGYHGDRRSSFRHRGFVRSASSLVSFDGVFY